MVRLYNDKARRGEIHAGYAEATRRSCATWTRTAAASSPATYDALMKRVEESMLDPASAMSVDEIRDALWNLLYARQAAEGEAQPRRPLHSARRRAGNC